MSSLSAVEGLLLWRDPVKTGGVFAGITLVYLLLEWSHYSLLTVIARVGLFAVVGSFLWNNLAQFINKYADLALSFATLCISSVPGVYRIVSYSLQHARPFLLLQARCAHSTCVEAWDF